MYMTPFKNDVLQKLYLLRYKQQSHVARKLGLNLSITDIKTAD